MLGCWGSGHGPEHQRWDAEMQPTEAAKVGGRAKLLSYPGDCEHTTSLNLSVSVTTTCNRMDKKRGARFASDLLYLYYQMCTYIYTDSDKWHCLWGSGLRQEFELSGHVLWWMKLKWFAKLVGTIFVCMQIICFYTTDFLHCLRLYFEMYSCSTKYLRF